MKTKIEAVVKLIKGKEIKSFRRSTNKVIVLFKDGSSWGVDVKTTDITVLNEKGENQYLGFQLKNFKQWDQVA